MFEVNCIWLKRNQVAKFGLLPTYADLSEILAIQLEKTNFNMDFLGPK
jgi:hypothetical protein